MGRADPMLLDDAISCVFSDLEKRKIPTRRSYWGGSFLRPIGLLCQEPVLPGVPGSLAGSGASESTRLFIV